MANDENLQKGIATRFCKETAAEAGRKGGLASGETRRKKRAMKEALQELLAMPIGEGDLADITAAGSPLENAIWNEFGTGEFALEGKGRKGGWWVRVGNGENEMRPEVAEAYEWPKVRKKMGKIVKVFTYGKRPQRSLFNAFEKVHKGAAKELAKKLNNAETEWKPNKIVGEKDLGRIEIKIGK